MNNNKEIKDKIKSLENLASKVLSLKQERDLRRPLLIEFCGSPKSGKSTTINSLNIFLKRNGFKTKLLTERASVCPVKNKKHPFFNLWTLSSATSEIIQHLDNKNSYDIIIADRGFFDALCWFNWLNNNPNKSNPHLDDVSFETLKKYILMDLWVKYIDLVYVFKVSPETSINREYASLLTKKRGSIMNEKVLKGFNLSIDTVYKNHSNNFRKITTIKTDTESTDNKPNNVSFEVTKNVLNILKDLLIEKIGYFDFTNTNIPFNEGLNSIKSLSNLSIKYNNRDIVEDDNNFIQPIAIAVITNKERNKVLVVKKNPKRVGNKSPEKDSLLLYIGGHIRQEDDKKNIIDTIKRALSREIDEEIGEAISVDHIEPFLIYTPYNEKSKKHLAVCYVIEMDLNDKKFKLTSDEFIMKTGTSKSGRILEIDSINPNNSDIKMESWSIEILKKVFKREYKDLFSGQQ